MILRHRESAHQIEDYSHQDALHRLEANMAIAMVYKLGNMPEDVIRLYSWVTVSTAFGWQKRHYKVWNPYRYPYCKV